MIDQLVKVFDTLTKAGRFEELSLLANDYKLDFKKRSLISAERTEIRGFKVFSKKGAKRFLGILGQASDKFNGQIRFYDFANTKDLETKTTSVIEINCEDIYVDYVEIEPKGTFSKMKGFFVSENLQFPELTTFNQQFQISSRRENGSFWLNKAALVILNDYPGLTMEAEGNNFLFYFRKKEMPVQDIIKAMDMAEEFVRLTCFDQSDDFV